MADCLRLYIHESNAQRCTAKGIHRSGSRVRPISFNDLLYGSDSETPCGVVLGIETERIDRENWVYRVSYVPATGTLHPVDSFVVWRQPESDDQPIVPQAVAHRMQPMAQLASQSKTLTPTAAVPIGRKRNKSKSVNGQHGKAEQASTVAATATV